MITNHEEPANADQIGNMPSWRSTSSKKRDLGILDEQIRTCLQSDQQKLKDAREQAHQATDKAQVRRLTERLTHYRFVEDFFLYLVQQGLSTQLAEISSSIVEDFINQQPTSISRARVYRPGVKRPDYCRIRARQELKAFFSRAVRAGVIQNDPLTALFKIPSRLEPQHPSLQTQTDCRAFRQYLQQQVDRKLLALSTLENYYRYLLILLHDAEKEHARNSDWPVELTDLFANPKWVGQWLNKAENYASGGSIHKSLARSSNKLRLNTIRHIWLWLKSEKRATDTYFKELKNMFSSLGDGSITDLPGRTPRLKGSLSEAEIQTIFECIDRYSLSSVQQLRDRAMLTTLLQTAIRLEGLNSMRIENFREQEPGIWDCKVRTPLRNPYRPADLAGYWYMSPDAIMQIGEYLQATGRDWQAAGPVWLTLRGQPLSRNGQRAVISQWLETAKCRFTGVQVLRHTSIDRMLNKFNLPLSVVQAITQCRDGATLLEYYRRYDLDEAARFINKLHPASADTASDEAE